MAEKGQVTQIKPNNKVVVKMLRTEACAKCRACAVFSSQEMVLEASNECYADVGDWVELELQQDGFLSAVLIMYGFPCACLLVGICIGYFLLGKLIPGMNVEIVSFVCGLIALLISHIVIKKNNHRWENNKKYTPVAARMAAPPTEEEAEYQLIFNGEKPDKDKNNKEEKE